VDDFMANLAVCCMVLDPKHPDTIYAGTGEGFHNLDALRGAGIFRTADGVSWRQLAATATADFMSVNRLAISRSGTVLLAATGAGILRSSDAHTAPWFSPALTVNYAGDPVIENRVVTEVASYGRQIGWLTEILLALAKNQPPSEETLRRLVPFAADLQQFPFVFALHSLALV
jgi:hypothetical protein